MFDSDKWTNKMWSTNIMEYDSTVKRNKILVNAAPWINLKNIMLHVRSQRKKSTCCMIPFIGVLRKSKPVETKSRLVTAWGWWLEEGLRGSRDLSGVMKMF